MRTVIVIPARLGAKRLPGKPLLDIGGKPMIQHVLERARAVTLAQGGVVVATDDQRVGEVVERCGGRVLLTSPNHNSGTERIVEVMSKIAADLYVNLQGDEPLMRSADIDQLIKHMEADQSISIGTLYHPVSIADAHNPNLVKVVLAANGDVLYFSRALIPFNRDHDPDAIYYKHIGVYAYRREVLAQYPHLTPPLLEKIEKLEQLRFLYAGFKIRAFEVAPTGPGVDTPEDLEHVRALISGASNFNPPHLREVRLLITDVDGVLTDGGIFYNETGECCKRFHARDGLGLQILQKCGVRVALISGRNSPSLKKRIADLGVTLYRFGVHDKGSVCREIISELGLTARQTAYIGDDSIDLSAFAACEFSFAVADAPLYIRQAATQVLNSTGGQGAFREVVDLILMAQGKEAILRDANTFTALMNENN